MIKMWEKFKEQCVCGREELLLVQTSEFFTFKSFYMHENLEKKKTLNKP